MAVLSSLLVDAYRIFCLSENANEPGFEFVVYLCDIEFVNMFYAKISFLFSVLEKNTF